MSVNDKESTPIKSNIDFFFDIDDDNYDEKSIHENEINYINDILKEFDNVEIRNDYRISQLLHYNENYTVKELLLIAEYYGFAKDLKSNKCNKDTIVNFLVDFESKPINSIIVSKRQNMWFYMNEVKNDKFMKKYVLW